MRILAKSSSGQQKMPSTQVVSLLNDNLIIFIRSWNGQEINQRITDEINHYMSSVEADLEVTSPFGYSENLSMLANKVKIALLLANDSVYNTENKVTYQNGAEVLIFFKKNNEITWASIGRFSATSLKEDRHLKLFDSGGKFGDDILLPVNLLGIMKNPEILVGSLALKKLKSIQISSSFQDRDSIWDCEISDF